MANAAAGRRILDALDFSSSTAGRRDAIVQLIDGSVAAVHGDLVTESIRILSQTSGRVPEHTSGAALTHGTGRGQSYRLAVLGAVALAAMVLAEPSGGATMRLSEAASVTQAMSRTPIGKNNPLHDAVRRNDFGSVQQLLANGADANAKDALGRAPLHYASRLGQVAIVQLLLNAGAEIDGRDNDAFTPLLRALQEGHTEVVQLLLRHGADGAAKTKDGTTAAELAMRSSNPEILKLLRQHLK